MQEEEQQLPKLPQVTNALILELLKFKYQHSGCTFKIFRHWLEHLYGDEWPQPDSPTCQAITRSTERLSAKLSKLKKQHTSLEKDDVLSEFLQQEFVLPTLGFRKGTVVSFSPVKKARDTKASDSDLKETKQKMYALHRNTHKQIKRRDLVIQKQNDCIRSQQEAIKKYERKLHVTESQLKKIKAKLDRVNHRAAYWKAKVSDSMSHCNSKKKKLRDEITSMKEEVLSLSLDNAELNDTVQSILKSEPEIATFENGKYTDDVRACVYELLSLNVGVRNVGPIVRCVLKNIAHKSVSRLPSCGLTCQMILESLTVVQAQLGDSLSGSSGFSTLQTDGTTKFGEHYTTYDVKLPDSEAVYTLGLRHVFSGSSHDTLETLQQILSDVDNVQLATGREAVSSKIMYKLKNTMSDRHSAEKLFNELLQEYRAEILPTLFEDWDEMAEFEKEQMTRMNNFFCGLHYLVGLAECTDEAIKLWECNNSIPEYELSSVSGTQQLIRTACKAFHHAGSQQCGSSTLFRSYLRKQGIFKIPLARFVGNRFNILFYDAAGVYYLKDYMIKFIESVHGNQANRLLQSVLKDLKNSAFVSGCRALGMIDKIVTGPLWRKLEESSISALQMGSTYCEMKEKFDSWSDDASTLIEGSAICFQDPDIHKDEVWDALVQSTTSDTMTQELLQLIFHAFSVTTQRLLIDHLPGGIYHDVTDDVLIEEASSVPTTNLSPERDFAVLDRFLREKPNAHMIALEALILFSHNKTSSWIEQLACDERESLFKAARTLAPTLKAKFKARRWEIEARREEDLKKRMEANARKEMKIMKEKEKLTKEMQSVGLWITRAEVDEGLDGFVKQAKKKEALKLQINFRHKVLNQSYPNKDVFKFSHNRRQHSVNQLKENLLLLIGASEESPTGTSLSNNSSKSLLEVVKKDPGFLVGKNIRHRFQVDEDLVWFNGTVLNMDSITKAYQVKYEGEDDIQYFALLDDISNGDLLLS